MYQNSRSNHKESKKKKEIKKKRKKEIKKKKNDLDVEQNIHTLAAARAI